MGVIANAFRPKALVTALPNSSGYSMGMTTNHFQQTTRAYMGNEIVSAGINLLATSAAEPHITGRRYRRNRPQTRAEARFLRAMGLPDRAGAKTIDAVLVRNGYFEEVPDHPLVELLNNPNPYMSRGNFWAGMVVDYYLAGNAYAIKARTSRGDQVAELWPVRPDTMKPIPGNMAAGEPFIKGYERRTGAQTQFISARDVLHFKTRNPMNPYEGISPVAVLLQRVTIDAYMTNFLRTFYERGGAGVGASLNVKNGKMDQAAKDDLRDRFKRMFSAGQYDVLISNAEDVTYTPFSLNRGLRDALPKEIDAVTEARIAMVLGIPGSILGLLIGYETSSYANQRQAWQVLWDVTMTPLLSDFDDVLNLGFKDEPGLGGIDEVYFDLSDIRALQEDEEALQERARKNVAARIWTMEEGRMKTGIGDLNAADHFLLPDGSAVKVSELDTTAPQLNEPEPAAMIAAQVLLPQRAVGRPRLEEDDLARGVYEEAMTLKARNPTLTWGQVAARVGVTDRTLRNYRVAFDEDE